MSIDQGSDHNHLLEKNPHGVVLDDLVSHVLGEVLELELELLDRLLLQVLEGFELNYVNSWAWEEVERAEAEAQSPGQN